MHIEEMLPEILAYILEYGMKNDPRTLICLSTGMFSLVIESLSYVRSMKINDYTLFSLYPNITSLECHRIDSYWLNSYDLDNLYHGFNILINLTNLSVDYGFLEVLKDCYIPSLSRMRIYGFELSPFQDDIPIYKDDKIPPDISTNLTSLEIIGFNEIMEAEKYPRLRSLKIVDSSCDWCYLISIPTLVELSLECSYIKILPEFTSLTSLTLVQSLISVLPRLPNLTSLDISNTKIRLIPSDYRSSLKILRISQQYCIISCLDNLTTLSISGNDVIFDLRKFRMLERLDISGCWYKTIISPVLKILNIRASRNIKIECSNLESIKISGCLDIDISNLSNVKHLDIEDMDDGWEIIW